MRLVLLLFLMLFCFSGAEELEVTIFEGGEGLGFYQGVAEDFRRLHPEIQVTLQGDPAMADRMRMRVLEGDLPEVTNANVDVWALIEHDQILDLSPWLDASHPGQEGNWRASFLPGSLSQYQANGKTYGVPLVYVVWSVYYNKALFRKHGWEPPQTWPQFFELCQKMKSAGVAPVAFQGRYSFYARPLVEHSYFHLLGRQGYENLQNAEPGAFEHSAMVEALGVLHKLAQECFQDGFQGMSHTEAQLEFFQGRAAMLFCGSWLFSEMQDNIPEDFELGAFPLPLPESDLALPGAQYASSGYFFVFKSSQYPSRGVEFLRLLTSSQKAGDFAAQRGMPVAVKGGNAGLHPSMKDVAQQLSQVKETFGPKSGVSIKGLDQVWNDNLALALAGTHTPQEIARRMEHEAQAARQSSQEPDKVELRHPLKATGFLLFLLLGLLVAISGSGREGLRGLVKISRWDVSRFLLPSALIFSLFFALPALVALGGACFRWDGLGAPEFVGLLQFKKLLLESDVFWLALGHNLILMFVPAIIVLPLSLLLAGLLHQGVVGARLFRIAFFFPNLIGVAGILLWQQLYNPQIGLVNKFLVSLGLSGFENFTWLSSQNLYYALIPMAVWGLAGFNMVLFLAAMQSVPKTLYEAADVEGAKAGQKFRYITLPLIGETVTLAAILMVIGGMKAFEAIWLLTNQAPTSETHVVGTLMIRSLFVEQRIGQAAALACLLFAVVLVGSLLTSRLSGEKS